MKRQRVSSEAIASFGYDAASRTLEIEFRSGAVYQYLDVPRSEFDNLIQADSLGGYVNTHIKPLFDYICVRPS